MKRVLMAIALLVSAAACESKSQPVASPDAVPRAQPSAAETVPPAASDAPTSPAPSGKLADVLSGRATEGTIPEAATDDGRGFDPKLRARLTQGSAPGPKLAIKVDTVTGDLPKEVVIRILRQQLGQFRRCYEESLKTNADAAGSQGATFVIDRQGKVSSSTATAPSFGDKTLAPCLTSALKKTEFPEPASPKVTVAMHIDFTFE